MAEIKLEEKKVIVKIVYYGPALSGKTTNLMSLHELLNPASCGEFMTFETKGDRTLFFDLLPLMVRSETGYKVKVKVFTVPGQVAMMPRAKQCFHGLTVSFSLPTLK